MVIGSLASWWPHKGVHYAMGPPIRSLGLWDDNGALAARKEVKADMSAQFAFNNPLVKHIQKK